MPSYAIGDIQGCFTEFKCLLTLIEFNSNSDKVYLVGDLVNRGPDSLAVLRFVSQHQPSISTVLGNHDLHLLACWAGVTKMKQFDTLSEMLSASDLDSLMHWLRRQPLILSLPDHVIVHAGVIPSIQFEKLVELAHFCEEKLSSDQYEFWLANMYGNTPLSWTEELSEVEKFRFGINVLTRMRMLKGSELDLKYKGEVEKSPKDLSPWFDFPFTCKKQVVFGHWSALGLVLNKAMMALDTGCIWGGQLTAVRLDDGALFHSPARSSILEGGE